MLQILRHKAGSIIVKVLFVLLILSFAVWGIGDIFRNRGQSDTVATVGDHTISLGQLDSQFRSVAQNQRIPLSVAQQLGLPRQVLDGMISGFLYDQLAADLGYDLSTDAVADAVRNNPMFRDPTTNQFSRDRFLQLLQAGGTTEAAFIAGQRGQLQQQGVMRALFSGAEPPQALVDPIYRYRREARVADTITLRNADQTGVPQPTQADLESYHKEHGDKFQSPEYRTLSVVLLNTDEFAKTVTVSEDEARTAYDKSPANYQKPEMRRFDQVIAPTKELADQIAAAVRGGKAVQQAVDESGNAAVKLIPVDFTAKSAMPIPALADPAFTLAEGQATDPVQSPFGWHVLVLTGIQPARTVPFEEARAEIEAQLKQSKAADALYDAANKFEDALADNVPIDKAAQEFGFTVTAVPAVAQDGTTQSGQPLPPLPGQAQILQAAFQAQQGDVSPMGTVDDKTSFIVRVDSIVPPATEPLAKVRDEVAAAWTEQKQADAAATLATDIAKRLSAGEAAADIAKAVGGQYAETPALLRDGSNAGAVPTALVRDLFAAQVGGTATAETPGGRVVARLTKVEPAKPDTAAEAAVKQDLRRGLAVDIGDGLDQALRARYGVTIDQAVLARLNYQE
ncbi:peptidyl-prolyl cis-trans isomerase [Inquilinus sp. Marseille-Q2685]|uniref:peptidyl-prolyl cis-trans isomerase n=1 Tax=Inquilinus sp. Marseille-Q2685 TaxID=2866581 RepID=UPI001CE445F5|nr:peptidyl-prolyl cis-trans isomerase [Inquilinus sp. Marseille-Q2685]